LYENYEIVPEIRPLSIPAAFFAVHDLVIFQLLYYSLSKHELMAVS
jgi:hypothetical protein